MNPTSFATVFLATLAVSTSALAQAPSASGLSTHAMMRGTLNDAAHPVVKSAVYFAEDDGSPSIDTLTRDQLNAEAARLRADGPPSLVMPIVLTSVGGAMVITAIIVLNVVSYSASLYFTAGMVVGLIIGIGLAVAGGVMLGIGIYRLVRSGIALGKYNARLEDINRRLGGGSVPATGGEAPPPPPDEVPPPPPPGARWNAPAPSLVLAEF